MCKYKIYQDEDNIDYIAMKLSCISEFIERLVKIVSSDLNEEKQIPEEEHEDERYKD